MKVHGHPEFSKWGFGEKFLHLHLAFTKKLSTFRINVSSDPFHRVWWHNRDVFSVMMGGHFQYWGRPTAGVRGAGGGDDIKFVRDIFDIFCGVSGDDENSLLVRNFSLSICKRYITSVFICIGQVCDRKFSFQINEQIDGIKYDRKGFRDARNMRRRYCVPLFDGNFSFYFIEFIFILSMMRVFMGLDTYPNRAMEILKRIFYFPFLVKISRHF